MRSSFLLAVSLLFLLTASFAYGQATEGSILGTVYDPSGSPVPNANVRVTGDNTGLARTTQTNETGEYVVAALPLGFYSVSVEQRGFKKALVPGVEITVKARVRADLHLAIGETTETVSVIASTPLLKTDTIEVSNLLTREQLQSLPVLSRHFLNLSILTPNSIRLPAGRQADLGGDSFAIGTQAADQNNFIIEGISNNMTTFVMTFLTPALTTSPAPIPQSSHCAAINSAVEHRCPSSGTRCSFSRTMKGCASLPASSLMVVSLPMLKSRATSPVAASRFTISPRNAAIRRMLHVSFGISSPAMSCQRTASTQ